MGINVHEAITPETCSDIKRVGTLYDGTVIYSFRRNGDVRTQIGVMAEDIDPTAPLMHLGVMAQDVETVIPEAVTEFCGFKHVRYDIASDPDNARYEGDPNHDRYSEEH